MSFTRKQLDEEIQEKTQDLEAFEKARTIIRTRVQQVLDSTCQLTPLPRWSGTDAVLGSLDLAVNAISRTLEELQALRSNTPPDPEEKRPPLRVVRNDE